MKTPLAWLNLLHNKARTGAAIAGVAFAVVLILMQIGFLNSVRLTATQIYDQLEFDILLTSPQYMYISKAGNFPRTRLFQARSVAGVADARPLYLDFNVWLNNAPSQHNPVRRGIFVIGFDLDKPPMHLPELRGSLTDLRKPGNVLIDAMSRKQFGDWHNNPRLEVGGQRINVVGQFRMGTGFGADGDIVTSEKTFDKLFRGREPDQVSLGLVTIEPGREVSAVAERLRRELPPDVKVYTRRQIVESERGHWVRRTSVGVIFTIGVIVGFIVGVAIVYQVLSSDITNHLAEYATLKAMGYSGWYLARVVLGQALMLALAGYLPGWAISKTLYWVTSESANIPMDLSWRLTLAILAASVVMCAVSGIASLRKVTAADPADLF